MQLLDSKSEDIFVTSHGVTSQIRRKLSSEKNWIPNSASFVLKKNIDRYLHDPTKARFQIVKYKTTTHYAHRCFQNFIDVFASVERIKILSMADTREVKHLHLHCTQLGDSFQMLWTSKDYVTYTMPLIVVIWCVQNGSLNVEAAWLPGKIFLR